jgi:hypothetical protein
MRKNIEKPYWEMTAEELATSTKQFDRPIPSSKTRPISSAERARFEKSRRAPHYSVFVTKDADGIFVRLTPDILRRSARYAAKHKLTLSDVINRGLKKLLAVSE